MNLIKKYKYNMIFQYIYYSKIIKKKNYISINKNVISLFLCASNSYNVFSKDKPC